MSWPCLLVVLQGVYFQVWSWDVPLHKGDQVSKPAMTKPNYAVTVQDAEPGTDKYRSLSLGTQEDIVPSVKGVLHTLPASVTTLAAHPCPIRFKHKQRSSFCCGLLAAVTSSGTLEIIQVWKAQLRPLELRATINLSKASQQHI